MPPFFQRRLQRFGRFIGLAQRTQHRAAYRILNRFTQHMIRGLEEQLSCRPNRLKLFLWDTGSYVIERSRIG